MIDWHNYQVTPPPLLSHVSSDDLKTCQQLILPTFRCHSQAVEQTIKDVSASSSKVYGHKSRMAWVCRARKLGLNYLKWICNRNTFL